MIVKITTGSDFKGAELYDVGLSKPGKIAEVLDCEGIDMDYDDNGKCRPDTGKIVASFNMQASMNPRVKKPVKHFVLTWPPEDLPKLTNEKIVEVVSKYLRAMGYIDTQFMITRHYEKNNPHVHVIVNMVNNYGQRINDKNEFRRNVDVCRKLTKEYGFTWGHHKWAHECDIPCDCRNRAYESVRYDICAAVANAMSRINDIGELQQRLILDGSGVTATLKRDNDGNPVGISFSKTVTTNDGHPITCKFSGTALDRRFTCGNLMRVLQLSKDFPKIAGEAEELLLMCDLADEAGYELPRSVYKQRARLEEEIRHMHYDQKRYERTYKGDCFKAIILVSLSIAYLTPLMTISTALGSALIVAIRMGQYNHAKSEKADVSNKLNNMMKIFFPEEYEAAKPVQKTSSQSNNENKTRKSNGVPRY